MGLDHFFRGFRLLARPGIRAWVIIPLLINILLFAGTTLLAIQQFNHLLTGLMEWLPAWLGFLAWLIWGLFGLMLAIIYGYTFTILANLIASPFYGLLAERTQNLLGDSVDSQPLSWHAAKEIAGRAFVRELRKLWYFVPRIIAVFLLCMLLSFVPILNLLAPFIVFLWGAWSLSLQYLDYPADINQVTFDDMRHLANDRKKLLAGFGGLILLGTSVPLVNLVVLPAAVTGATSLWLAAFNDDNSAPAQ